MMMLSPYLVNICPDRTATRSHLHGTVAPSVHFTGSYVRYLVLFNARCTELKTYI